MGIKLQKYQQQTVTPSDFSGKEVSIQAAAQAPLQAAAAQQDMVQGVMGALQSRKDYKERQGYILEKRAKAITDQYETDAADQATLAVAQYESSWDTVSPSTLGDLQKDEGYMAMNKNRDAYLADVPPENQAAVKREWDFKIAQSVLKAQGEGTNRLMSKGRTQTEAKINNIINSMTDENSEAMLGQANALLSSDQVQDYFSSEPAKLTELKNNILPGYQTLQVRDLISKDPSEALRIASNQLSGKEVTYGSLSAANIKALKSEALTAMKAEQDELANSTWLSDNYKSMSDTDKMATINQLVVDGKISSSKGLAEQRRIEEDPKLSPSEITKLGEARADIRLAAAGRHPDGKTVQELVEEYGSGMHSQDYMSRLSSYSLREIDPDAATSGRAYVSVRKEFAERLAEMATDGALIEPGKKFLWLDTDTTRQFQGMDKDQRESAAFTLNQASIVELQDRLDDWRMKNPDASTQDVRLEAQEIFQQVSDEFAQANTPSLIQEYNLLETAATQEGDERTGRTNPVRDSKESVDANESNIVLVMSKLNIDREEAIQKLKDNNRWK
tara:strand:- start:448 stop:2127 length:1680 start_codon:yes stop_codon:yes gene_type:complete